MRKVISVVFYVIAGFFVYTVTLLAFVNMDALPSAGKAPAWAKFAIMGGFSIPAAIALLIGAAIDRFQHWKRDLGIVLVSGAGTTAVVAFTMACLLMSPEVKKLFPPGQLDVFSDLVAGVSCIAAVLAVGVVLIKISRKDKRQTLAKEP